MKLLKSPIRMLVLILVLAAGYIGGLMTSSVFATVATAPTFKSDNLYFIPAADPTGNGESTAQLVYKASDGTLHYPAFYIFLHNSAGLKAFVSNGADTTAFETDTNGRLAVQYP
jgi:hypothetical protein